MQAPVVYAMALDLKIAKARFITRRLQPSVVRTSPPDGAPSILRTASAPDPPRPCTACRASWCRMGGRRVPIAPAHGAAGDKLSGFTWTLHA